MARERRMNGADGGEVLVFRAGDIASARAVQRVRADLADALLAAGWGTDAGRVLMAVGAALPRPDAPDARPRVARIAFVVGPRGARVRIVGAFTATPAAPLADRVARRTAGGEGVVLLSFDHRPAPRAA